MKNYRLLTVLSFFLMSLSIIAQDINQAGEVYNAGNQALKDGNLELALQKYNQSIDMASKLGTDGEQIVTGAKSKIPNIYYQMGAASYKSDKINEAIAQFEQAIKFGEMYGDAETVTKSRDIMPKLYYARGNDEFKEDKIDAAFISFSKTAELDPNYFKAYWGLGLVYSKQNKIDEADAAFSKALKMAQAEGDTKMAEKISTKAKNMLQAEGATKLQTKSYEESLKYCNAALKYDEKNKDIYYYFALANNGLKKWDDAIQACQKGLENSVDENDEFKAKYHYEMGNAYKGKGMNDDACAAYKKAVFGRFVESANYEIKTTLKCK